MTVLQQIDEPFEFFVCGGFENDRSKNLFEEMAKSLGDKVKYLGFLEGEKKREIFQDADVLLLPSYGEGLPMVVLEALEAGCSVITTDVGAIPEIVTLENGVIIKPGDLLALKNAIEAYLTMDADKLKGQQWHNHEVAKVYSLMEFADRLAQIVKAAYFRKK